MNIKRLIFAIVAGWVVILGTDMLIHHLWLMPYYEATKAIWRPEEEMHTRIQWMFVAQFLSATTFVIIWAKGFAGGTVGTGVVFGLLMGLFQAIWVLVNYVLIPMPGDLAVRWFFSGLAQAMVLGIVVSLVYKPASPSSAT